MELSSTLIGIFVMASFVLPIVYLQGIQKRKEKLLLAEFIQLSKEKGLEPTQTEVWNYVYCLALSKSTKQLLYFKKSAEMQEVKAIDLAPFKHCTVNKIVKTVKTSDGPVKVIEALNLALVPNNPQHKAESIVLYKAEESRSITTELPLITKWEKLINQALMA